MAILHARAGSNCVIVINLVNCCKLILDFEFDRIKLN